MICDSAPEGSVVTRPVDVKRTSRKRRRTLSTDAYPPRETMNSNHNSDIYYAELTRVAPHSLHHQASSYSTDSTDNGHQAAIVVPLDSLPEDIEQTAIIHEQVENFHTLYGPKPSTLADSATNGSGIVTNAEESGVLETVGEFVHKPRRRSSSIKAYFPLPSIHPTPGANDSTQSLHGNTTQSNDSTNCLPIVGHGEVLSDAAHRQDLVVVQIDAEYAHVQLLQMRACYELLAHSNKLVTLDIRMPLNKAFYALVFNSVRMALLWDGKEETFVGTISNTDFIHALMTYEHARDAIESDSASSSAHENMDDSAGIRQKKDRVSHSKLIDAYLAKRTIQLWREEAHEIAREGVMCGSVVRPMFTVSAKASVLRAARIMQENHLYRLVVVDERNNTPLAIINHSRILRFLFSHADKVQAPKLFAKLPRDIGIGTWTNLVTARESSSLWSVMKLMIEKSISGLPVLHDDDDTVVDMYTRFDVISLAYNDCAYDLHALTMAEALQMKQNLLRTERVSTAALVTCYNDDTIGHVLATLVDANVYRVLVLCRKTDKLVGIITASDIVKYLMTPAYELINMRRCSSPYSSTQRLHRHHPAAIVLLFCSTCLFQHLFAQLRPNLRLYGALLSLDTTHRKPIPQLHRSYHTKTPMNERAYNVAIPARHCIKNDTKSTIIN